MPHWLWMDLIEEQIGAGWVEYFGKDFVNVHPTMIQNFWSSMQLYIYIVERVLGVHVSISQESISQVTSCPNKGLIYKEGWDVSLLYSLKNFVHFFFGEFPKPVASNLLFHVTLSDFIAALFPPILNVSHMNSKTRVFHISSSTKSFYQMLIEVIDLQKLSL